MFTFKKRRADIILYSFTFINYKRCPSIKFIQNRWVFWFS